MKLQDNQFIGVLPQSIVYSMQMFQGIGSPRKKIIVKDYPGRYGYICRCGRPTDTPYECAKCQLEADRQEDR